MCQRNKCLSCTYINKVGIVSDKLIKETVSVWALSTCTSFQPVVVCNRAFIDTLQNYNLKVFVVYLAARVSTWHILCFGCEHQCPTFLLEREEYRPWLHLSSGVSVLPQPLDFTMIMEASDDAPAFDSNIYRLTDVFRLCSISVIWSFYWSICVGQYLLSEK